MKQIVMFSGGASSSYLAYLVVKEYGRENTILLLCTTDLKIKQSRKFWNRLKDQGLDFIVHFGYGADEWRRVQKQLVRFEKEGIKSKYLIFERRIDDKEIKRIIQEDWEIELPRAYKYLKHNNCIPCFKGGKGHFKQVAKYYPEQFKRAMALEEKIGHTVFKDCTLQDLWDEVQASKNQLTFLEDDDSWGIPCDCIY